MFRKRIVILILMVCFCTALTGCASILQKVEDVDGWMRDELW